MNLYRNRCRWSWWWWRDIDIVESDPLLKQIYTQMTLGNQCILPKKSNLSRNDSWLLLIGFATKYSDKYIPDCIQMMMFEFYFERTYQMSNVSDSGDLYLDYKDDKNDELLVTLFSDRNYRTNTMISSFVIKQGGVYLDGFLIW